MIRKKICMLGAFAVGKTSLVRRYVENLFSEKYQATMGVKVDKKVVTIDGQTVSLILWDMAGNDEYHKIRTSYLRGASGYLLVVDKTRTNTLDAALGIHKIAQDVLGKAPCLMLINKWDLEGKWDIADTTITDLCKRDWGVIKTSAKTGMSVNEAFETLARRIIELGT
jgi:small GTP-binding protein